MRALRWSLVVSVALAVSAPTRASAQQPSLADRETARTLMDEGDRQRKDGDLEGALKSYEAADALMRVPTTGIDVARTQIALGKLLEARETLASLLRIPAKRNEPAPFVAARKAADALYDELSSKIPSIEILVDAPPGAELRVTIDGEPVPTETLGMARKVNPGVHVIVVRSGEIEKTAEVDVREGEERSVEIEISEAAPAEGPSAPEGKRASTSESKGWVSPVMTYSGFGLAAVGLVTGTVTGIMSLSQTNELKERCPGDVCPPGSQEDLDSATALGNVSTVAFVAGGVGLAVGVVGLLLPTTEARTTESGSAATRARYRAVVGPSYLGVAGTF